MDNGKENNSILSGGGEQVQLVTEELLLYLHDFGGAFHLPLPFVDTFHHLLHLLNRIQEGDFRGMAFRGPGVDLAKELRVLADPLNWLQKEGLNRKTVRLLQ